MATKAWQTVKVCYCPRVEREVSLEAEVVYPHDLLPDQPGRVTAHRCSYGIYCNLDGKPACIWAGTNPLFNPFDMSEE
jgi:hypothetical protein